MAMRKTGRHAQTRGSRTQHKGKAGGKGDATLISLCQNVHPHTQDIDRKGSGILAARVA